MDYVEAFKNLRTNNKYGRKSPHKAVLMLTVIELFEKSVLTDNEIFYDDKLKSMFLKMWNRVLPDEPLFHPDAYLPFWYLQNDSFWHIVPIRGKEDILSLMRDTNIKPSEAKLKDSVKCAELDDDLYFLMTIASGRSSLKRALLETYTALSEEQIERMAESKDNTVDHSAAALSEYESILSGNDAKEQGEAAATDNMLVRQFQKISEDLQIVLNLEYFSFLKKHPSERGMMKEICPTVYDLFDKIVNHPVRQGEIAPSFTFVYENFLADLKISLMSENDSMELIDKIGVAIETLRGNAAEVDTPVVEERTDAAIIEEKDTVAVENKGNDDSNLEVEHVFLDGSGNVIDTVTTTGTKLERNTSTENRRGKPWTEEEEEQLRLYFQQGRDTAKIAAIMGRTEVAIKSRMGMMGLIEYTYGQEETIAAASGGEAERNASQEDFNVENSFTRAYILNGRGEKVFSTDGKLKFMGGKLYRLNLKGECFTVKGMLYNGEVWMKGGKKIVAYPQTKLYRVMDRAYDYSEAVEEIADSPVFEECRLKVNGEWYNYKGESASEAAARKPEQADAPKSSHIARIVKNPLYAVRKQAILRAMGYFRLPAKIKDIARTISRTAWGTTIREDDVEEIINTIDEVESVDGKYVLRKKR